MTQALKGLFGWNDPRDYKCEEGEQGNKIVPYFTPDEKPQDQYKYYKNIDVIQCL
jgi:hypothetical protein